MTDTATVPEGRRRWKIHRQRTTKARFKPGHFGAWRRYRNLSLDMASERARAFMAAKGYTAGCTPTTLGRLEKGLVPFAQPIVEALAHVYGTDELALLSHDPAEAPELWEVWNGLTADERRQAVKIILALRR